MRLLKITTLLALLMSVTSCYKDDLVQDVPHQQDPDYGWGKSDTIPIVKQFYFKGKIDSLHYTFQDSVQNYVNIAYGSNYAPCDSGNYLHGQVTGFYDTLSGRESLEIKLLGCVSDTTSKPEKETLLYLGTYPYGSSSFINPVAGVEVTWIDKFGRKWSSLPGSGQALEDSFRILKIDVSADPSRGEVIISGYMDIHLYYDNQSIPIEGAEFVMLYGKY